MGLRRVYLGLILLLVCLTCLGQIKDSGRPASVSRKILHLYDSRDREFSRSNTHEMAQVVFDHLGLVIQPHDIRAGLPRHEEMGQYRGIFTWLTDWELPEPEKYLIWLAEECRRGRYVVVWGHLGAYANDEGKSTEQKVLDDLYKLWGFKNEGILISGSLLLRKAYASPEMMGFEAEAKVGIADFVRCVPDGTGQVEVYMSVREHGTKHPPYPVVVRHKYGGFALESFIYDEDPRTNLKRWIVNPFAYFRACFRLDDMPAVDLTTRNGCRMRFSHIDGDGSLNLSETDPTKISLDVIYEEILTKYDVPTTASVVEGEVIRSASVEWIKDRKRVEDSFRRVFRLDNVEAGSHGCTHPMHWAKGVSGMAIPGISRKAKNKKEEEWLKSLHYANSAIFTLKRDVWLKREITDSAKFINTLLPEGKRCGIMLWTGNCKPGIEGVKLANANGMLNINGGDPVFDSHSPTYGTLSPAYLRMGDVVQYYSAGSNEMIYTDTWAKNYAGFRNVINTFVRTGFPRRIKPIDIYYHFYSGERYSSLRALKQVYDYSEKLDLANVFTSDYIRLVRNSMEIQLFKRGDTWMWKNAKQCRTLRWDTVGKVPDLATSEGVIGYYNDPDLKCLYIHLDGRGTGKLNLKQLSANPLHLSRATGCIDDWRQHGEACTFTFSGLGKSWIELGGCRPKAACTLWNGTKDEQLRSDATGKVRIELPDKPFIKNLTLQFAVEPGG